jgi:hypothetical protein
LALVPKVPPVAVNVVEPGLQISAPVIPVGATDGCDTVIVFVTPAVESAQGPAVFFIFTQYVVVTVGDTVKVELVAPPIGLVPGVLPVPHW